MSQLDRRQLLRMVGGLAVAGMAGSAAGCTSEPEGSAVEQPSGRTIMVGFIAPAVGAYGPIGDEITKGVKLYLKDSNNLAGTHTVDLLIAEEGATQQTFAAAVKSLLSKGVLAIGGVANPAALSVVADAANDQKVPLISATASPAALGRSQAFTWRVGYVQGEPGLAIAPYARAEGDQTFVMHDGSPAGTAEANAFSDGFVAAGGTVVQTVSGGGSFAAKLQSARNKGANSIFAAFSGGEAADLLTAFRAANLQIKLLGPPALTETVDLTKLGTLPQRVYTSGFYAPDLDNEDNRRFVSSYHKQYGTQPSSFAMAGYDTISVLDKILRLVEGDLTPLNVNRAASLLGRIESPRGTWSFNVNRTPQQKWYLRKLRIDGQVPANLLDNDLAVLS